MDSFGVLIIGLGNIALGYDLYDEHKVWTHVKAILTHPKFHVIAGIDPNGIKRSRFEKATHKSSFANLENFESYNNGELARQVDVVVIATPTEYHMSQYYDVLHLKPKLVLMEKPVSDEWQDTDAQALRNSDCKVMVNLFRLYQRQVNELLERYSHGVCEIQARYSQSALHNGIHFYSLIERHFGQPISGSCEMIENGQRFDFEFKQGSMLLSPCQFGVEDNSLIVHSCQGSLYYLSGGRHAFFIDKNMVRHDFEEDDLMRYQYKVYDQCLHVLEGGDDDSLELALSAQKRLLERYHEVV